MSGIEVDGSPDPVAAMVWHLDARIRTLEEQVRALDVIVRNRQVVAGKPSFLPLSKPTYQPVGKKSFWRKRREA
jgi:hypothetical protein